MIISTDQAAGETSTAPYTAGRGKRGLFKNQWVGTMSDETELGLARKLNRMLRDRGLSVAVAEGTTGGRIGERLVRYPGATAYFKGSVVTYDYPSRTSLLDVPQELLQTHGSVSETAVRAMAERVREKFRSDIGIASSGSVGPAGSDVGHLWIAATTESGTVAREHHLRQGTRLELQGRFTLYALQLLRDTVINR